MSKVFGTKPAQRRIAANNKKKRLHKNGRDEVNFKCPNRY
jgi:hypothetical protein